MSPFPVPIFQRRQWANPSAEFHKRTPGDRREMQPRQARPFQEQEPAHEHEEHEAEVEYHYEVSAQLVEHENSVEKTSGWCKRRSEAVGNG